MMLSVGFKRLFYDPAGVMHRGKVVELTLSDTVAVIRIRHCAPSHLLPLFKPFLESEMTAKDWPF